MPDRKPGYNLMIIEDDQNISNAISVQFKSLGFNVEVASNGKQAFEKLEQFNPDIMLLDLNMPVMDGVSFYFKLINKKGKLSHPLVILSAEEYIEEWLYEINADAFISKPFEINLLVDKVNELIKEYKVKPPK